MNYRLETTKIGDEFFWSIEELQTEQIVFKSPIEKETKELYRRLKRGFGFNGWTPAFFLVAVNAKGESNG